MANLAAMQVNLVAKPVRICLPWDVVPFVHVKGNEPDSVERDGNNNIWPDWNRTFNH